MKNWGRWNGLRMLLPAVLLLLGGGHYGFGVVYYVNVKATNVETGLTWGSAFRDLQDALALAEAGDEIWVARGVYKPGNSRTDTFRLQSGVAVYGGFNGGEEDVDDREPHGCPTILSGDIDDNDILDAIGVTRTHALIRGANSYSVVTASGVDDTAILSGFIITGGSADIGSGSSNSDKRSGGGLYANGGSPQLTELCFIGNFANVRGGGAYFSGGSPEVEDSLFDGNFAAYGGGSGNYTGAEVIYNRCTFQNNECSNRGGGLRNSGATVNIGNSLFAGNKAPSGGGIHNENATALLVNVTLASNLATSRGGGMSSMFGGQGTVHNSIFWGNAVNGDFSAESQLDSLVDTTVDSAIIQGGEPSGVIGSNIDDEDPFFNDLPSANTAPHSNGDYRVDSPNSSAVDTGDNDHLDGFPGGMSVDIQFFSRIRNGDDQDGSEVDLGAHERPAKRGPLRASITSVSIDSGQYLIASDASNGDADYDRHEIAVSADVQFFGSGINFDDADFRVGFQLQDEWGNPIPLENVSNTRHIRYLAVENISASAFSPANETFEVVFKPAKRLNPYVEYQVAVYVEERQGLNPFFFFYLRDDDTSASQRIFHFTSTNSNDFLKNVITEISTVNWMRLHAVNTSPSEDAFRAECNFTLRRYDAFDSGAIFSDVDVFFNYQLRNAVTHEAVPLEGADAFGWAESNGTYSVRTHLPESGEVPKNPSVSNLTHDLLIKPAAETQLDSVNNTYYVAVKISYVDFVFREEGNRTEGLNAQLLHFNGRLNFAHIHTTITNIFNVPENFILGQDADGISLELGIQEAYVDAGGGGESAYTFSHPAVFEVLLKSNGDAEMEVGDLIIDVDQPVEPDVGTMGRVQFTRSQMKLRSLGLFAVLDVKLPSGMGWSGSKDAWVLENTLGFGSHVLNQYLEPLNSEIIHFPSDDLFVMEESKPVLFEVSQVKWKPGSGEFEMDPKGGKDVHYVRENEYSDLEEIGQPPLQVFKASNEVYYRGVLNVNGKVLVTADDEDNSSKLTVDIDVEDFGLYQSHFPYNASFLGITVGEINISEDVPSGALNGVQQVTLTYSADCSGDSCNKDDPPPGEIFQIEPISEVLSITSDGGLTTTGVLIGDQQLRWGYRGNNQYAYETSDFARGDLVIAGHAMTTEEPLVPTDFPSPSILLHTGLGILPFGETEFPRPDELVRPNSVAHQTGDGFFPGMNLNVGFDPNPVTCASYLGDSDVPIIYDLSLCSKYYVRQGGISGIHDADLDEPFSNLNLYGYSVTLDVFSLSFLLSENIDSATAGSLTLPFPTDETFAFEELLFDCFGGLVSAQPPSGSGKHHLSYWGAAEFQPLAFAFETDADPACASDPKFLTAGVKSWVSHLPTPIFGTLGFAGSGELITRGSGELEAVDSRLNPPNQLRFNGPAEETYLFTTVLPAYYSDYGSAPDDGPGYLNLFGSLDVAFFQNFDCHLGLAGIEDDTDSLIKLAGGWEDENGLRFTSNEFDPSNRGFEQNADSPNDYFTDADFYPVAQHSWLNVIDFEYPLVWDSGTRHFHSPNQESDLVVIRADHQVRYLSARRVDIKFGVLFDGLPEVSLTNIAYDLVDEGTGVLSSVREAAGEAVSGTLNSGMDQLDKLLSDRMDQFFEELLEAKVDEILGNLYDALEQAYEDNGGWIDPEQYRAIVLEEIKGIVAENRQGPNDPNRPPVASVFIPDDFPVDNIQGLLTSMGGSIEWEVPGDDISLGTPSGFGLTFQIDQYLAELENAIRSLTDGINLDPGNPNLADILPPVPAINHPDFVGDFPAVDDFGIFAIHNGQFPNMSNLMGELLGDLAGELLANLENQFGDFPGGLAPEIDGYLQRITPAIDTIRENLERVRRQISEFRLRLNTDILDRFNRRLLNPDFPDLPSVSVDDLTSLLCEQLEDYIRGIELRDVPFPEISRQEFIDRGKRLFFDDLFRSDIVSGVQNVLRSELGSLEDMLLTNIDSAFAQLNEVIRDLLTEYLEGFDPIPVDFLEGLPIGGAELNGYASIRDDTLRKLRLDLGIELSFPDSFNFHGFLEIKQEQIGNAADNMHVKVTMGADGIPVSWSAANEDARIGVQCFFRFNEALLPEDLGGSIELQSGEIAFSEFRITLFSATCAVGINENYLGAAAQLIFTDYELGGAFFFGHAITMEPLEFIAGDVSAIIGDVAPFTGVYMYGNGYFPIFGASCVFKISAGVGAGIWYFDGEEQVFGGRMNAAVGGEALCLISIRGEIDMLGTKVGNDFNFRGRGRLSGKAGVCPFCKRFGKTVTITYRNGSWDVDY